MVTFEEIPGDAAQASTSSKASKHVRPRNRSKLPPSNASAVASVDPHQPLATSSNEASTTGPTTTKPTTHKSILKTPKYTRQLMDAAAATAKEVEEASAVLPSTPQAPPPCKNAIVERKVHRQSRRNKTNKGQNTIMNTPSTIKSTSAIEGYSPVAVGQQHASRVLPHTSTSAQESSLSNSTSDSAPPKNDEEKDMVFNSLADLMQAAGTLPEDQSTDKEGTVVEADLSFSVMSPEDYAAQLERDEEGQVDSTNDPALDEVSEGDDDFYESEETNDDEYSAVDDKENSDDEGMWDILHDTDDLDEATETREPRAFLQIWKALSQWVTPAAVEYVLQQRRIDEDENELPTRPPETRWSDVESTRCAGLMSLLQLYLGPCLQDDLQLPLEERRRVELRLGYLIRCFDYSQASPKLNAQHARALTCILIQTVMLQQSDDLPPSCAKAELSWDEYQYLIRSGIANFQSEASEVGPRNSSQTPYQ